MYQVFLSHQVSKEIESFPDDVISLILDVIESLKSHPRPHGVKKLVGGSGWRVRVREYRILYDIDDRRKIISVYKIKHRKDAYR
jgi:mRNA interferase RelE/StbE